MRRILFLAAVVLVYSGCGDDQSANRIASPVPTGTVQESRNGLSLADARRNFTTTLKQRSPAGGQPLPIPPQDVMRFVSYTSPAGTLKAYLTPPPKDGRKHPAIVWITGGDCNSIDDGCWTEGPPENEQSAAAFRMSDIVVMFPSLRGGNDNPGNKEGMYGEVDDILAAAELLAQQPGVDSKRIYLGGHSSGGTLVLLAAECSNKFRAVFSFGPVSSIAKYGMQYITYDFSNRKETELRAPGLWLSSIQTPTFVLEGTEEGNLTELELLTKVNKNPLVHFFPVRGASHFSVLAPSSRVIVDAILHDTKEACNIELSQDALDKAVALPHKAR